MAEGCHFASVEFIAYSKCFVPASACTPALKVEITKSSDFFIKSANAMGVFLVISKPPSNWFRPILQKFRQLGIHCVVVGSMLYSVDPLVVVPDVVCVKYSI